MYSDWPCTLGRRTSMATKRTDMRRFRFFTTDVRAASELALDLPTEERVERFGRPTLIEQFDSEPPRLHRRLVCSGQAARHWAA
jgi:hypothetical protein